MVDAFAVGLLRRQGQAELLTHDAGEETAHRVLLPSGRLHDRSDRCSLGLLEQPKNPLLFGPAASRTRGNLSTLCRLLRALGWRDLDLPGCAAVRHDSDPFGFDGKRAVTTEAPQWRYRQRGGIRDEAKGLINTTTLTLRLQRKSSPFWKKCRASVGATVQVKA